FFTEAERAALDLTDAVTRLGDHGVPDGVWDAARAAFDEATLGHLVVAIGLINLWNRLAVTTHAQPPALAERAARGDGPGRRPRRAALARGRRRLPDAGQPDRGGGPRPGGAPALGRGPPPGAGRQRRGAPDHDHDAPRHRPPPLGPGPARAVPRA